MLYRSNSEEYLGDEASYVIINIVTLFKLRSDVMLNVEFNTDVNSLVQALYVDIAQLVKGTPIENYATVEKIEKGSVEASIYDICMLLAVCDLRATQKKR